MLTYSFENYRGRLSSSAKKQSLYFQLYECIRADILNGTIAPNEKLPSKRALALHLGISTITVENAYAKLSDEGYVYSLAKKGFFASDILVASQVKNEKEITPFAQKNKSLHEKKTRPVPDNTIHLSATYTQPALFPFATWSRLVRRVLSERAEDIMRVSPPGGVEELRTAIANHLYEFRGMRVQPEQIVVGAGTEYLYSLIIQLLGYKNTFAVEDPGYSKIAQVYDLCNVRCVPVALDSQGMCIDGLDASGATIAHISPSHHFPTGRTTSIGRRYELLGWAAGAPNRYIIEDDYDAEFRLNGRIIPTLQSIDTIDRVIYLNTFTKTLSPTIRISYLVLPLSLTEQFYSKLGFYSNTVPTMNQYTLAMFMGEGHFESHINRLRRRYRAQKDAAVSCIQRESAFQDSLILEADAGLYFLLRLHTKKSDAELKAAALRRKLHISFLSEFYAHKDNVLLDEAAHTVIVNYASLLPDAIEKAIKKLAQALKASSRLQ